MAVDKLVDSTQLNSDLTSVADAIRAKSGGSSSLAFPADFVSEIGNIETGGGGTDYLALALSNTLETYENDNLTTIPITYALAYRGALKTLKIKNVTAIQAHAFDGTSIEALVLPKFSNALGWQVFYGMSKLKILDILGHAAFYNQLFSGCSVLDTLIIRRITAPSLANINAFAGTPFASSGSGGTLYVPSALISDYEAATNWSTILGYENNQILPIEGSIYETQYADGTPIST